MDFITGLPKFEGKSVIMVVVDRIIKYVDFCALTHPFKVIPVAIAFMETIQKLRENPNIIVSDKDPIFTRNFWIELVSCLGTQLAHSSSYHPQSNGKIEIVKKNWNDIFVYLYLINRHNGSSGYLWLNGGITLPSIMHQKLPHLWHFMDIIHPP